MSARQWVGSCLLSFVGVALWLVPRVGQTLDRPRMDRADVGPATAELAQTRREAARLDGIRKRVLRLREFEEVARGPTGAMRSFTLAVPPDVDPESRARLHDRLSSALNERGGAPRIPVGLFVVDHARHALTDLGGWVGRERYVGDGSDPYCFSVIERRGRAEMSTWLDARLDPASGGGARALLGSLGPCAFYARYGLPGGYVAAWLKSGGHAYASLLDGDRLDPRALRKDPFRRLFGRMGKAAPRLTLQRCAGGDLQTCARIFREVKEPRHESAAGVLEAPSFVTFPDRRGERRYVGASLLAYLADEFGDDRFEAFWTSGLPMESAFEAAFGTTTGEWLHGFVRDRWGSVALGAGLTRADVRGSLLFLLLCVALSFRLGRRRATATREPPALCARIPKHALPSR